MFLIFFPFFKADVIERLRLQYTKELLKVVDIVLSHQVILFADCILLDSFFSLSDNIFCLNAMEFCRALRGKTSLFYA